MRLTRDGNLQVGGSFALAVYASSELPSCIYRHVECVLRNLSMTVEIDLINTVNRLRPYLCSNHDMHDISDDRTIQLDEAGFVNIKLRVRVRLTDKKAAQLGNLLEALLKEAVEDLRLQVNRCQDAGHSCPEGLEDDSWGDLFWEMPSSDPRAQERVVEYIA